MESTAQQSSVLTVEEAARELGISRVSAYQAVKVGEIPSVRIGKRILIPKARLRQMLGEPPFGSNDADAIDEEQGEDGEA